MSEFIITESRNKILRIEINRPEKKMRLLEICMHRCQQL